MYFIGVDVGGKRKGQAVAVLHQDLRVVSMKAGQQSDALAARILEEYGNEIIVAIDAPRQPGKGRTGKWGRGCEREAMARGLRPQWTPEKEFFITAERDILERYSWMEIGFKLFEQFCSELEPHQVIEVFPSASYGRFGAEEVLIPFGLWDRKSKKDQLDAICCALTAWCYYKGHYLALGDADEGQIIIPHIGADEKGAQSG